MPRYTDKQIADTLIQCRGMVYIASKQLGCSHNTIKDRVAKSQALRDIVEAESESAVDLAELKLVQAIQGGQPWSIALMLKTKGKNRGYVERHETTGPNGTPQQHEHTITDYRDLPADELGRLYREKVGQARRGK